ncbi:MAG: ECF transporter S component [Lutisporaceae bacterium]
MGYKNTSSTKMSQNIREMVQIALMAAITYISVSYLHIPYGVGGVVHLGDSIIFVTAILFGARQAAISGAIGMTLFDIFFYPTYAPYTFFIKAGMGLIAGLIARSGNSQGNKITRNIIGIVLAGVLGVVGYYIAEVIMYSNFYTPLGYVLGNIIQVTAGGIIAMVLLPALKRTRYFGNS